MAKIILTHEVSGLGAPGDVLEVKDGYARNYLLPRKLATPWTKGGEKEVAALHRARSARALATVEDALAARDALASAAVEVKAHAGASGRLFGTVTSTEIADAVKAAGGPAIDKRKIVIDQRIKALGEYTVKVALHEQIQANLVVHVVADE